MKSDLVKATAGTFSESVSGPEATAAVKVGPVRRWMSPFIGALMLAGIAINTVICITPMVLVTPIKLLAGNGWLRDGCDRFLIRAAETWISINNGLLALLVPTRWVITGLDGLTPKRWYMLVANHQSWVDILVLQKVFNRRVPFMKFFIKRELIWMPLLGFAWWILDFPFMKRAPHGKGQKGNRNPAGDLEVALRACDKFKRLPVTVMNFAEGTRFTPEKHQRQRSPHKHLLRPKCGGAAIVFTALGDQLSGMLDVTIFYPHGAPTVWAFLCGRTPTIRVAARVLPFLPELAGDYLQDAAYRRRIQAYFNALWEKKDQRLTEASKSPFYTGQM